MKPERIYVKWGEAVEAIRGDTREAVKEVLGYLAFAAKAELENTFEQRLQLPAGMAHAQNAYDMGKSDGLKEALLALTDPEHIAQQRGLLEDQFTKEK